MKVSELIMELKNIPDNYDVKFLDNDECITSDINSVIIEEIQKKEHCWDYGIDDETPLPLKIVLLC